MSERRSSTTEYAVVERPDHHCGDDIVQLCLGRYCEVRSGLLVFQLWAPMPNYIDHHEFLDIGTIDKPAALIACFCRSTKR